MTHFTSHHPLSDLKIIKIRPTGNSIILGSLEEQLFPISPQNSGDGCVHSRCLKTLHDSKEKASETSAFD